MVGNETLHLCVLSAARGGVRVWEETPEEVVVLRVGEEFSPEALRVENILRKG